MTRRERVLRTLEGGHPDRPPVSFWRHFPDVDHDPVQLAETLVAFQRRYDLDLVKLMPSGVYGVEDYGCTVGAPDPATGAKRVLHTPVDGPDGWAVLERVLPPDRGARGRELRCLELVRRALRGGEDVPVLQTVFSPATTVAKAAGRDRWLALLRSDPAHAHRVLAAVARTEQAFVAACLAAGADGVFFATQLAGDGVLTEQEYATFGVPYDLVALAPLAGRQHLSVLHLHGARPLFHLFADYPLPIINWHDRRTSPDLVEGRARWPRGAVAGGLDERGVVHDGPAARIRDDVVATIRRTGGVRHLLAPGCVVPVTTPAEHLDAVRAAVAGLRA
ncbi:MAG: uroporphyrinogen decarboxylase family protein [Armatimonadota bacterium]|nr:uroporphyrinogen decarboxylase family protein [Armatimonadota bacterium]